VEVAMRTRNTRRETTTEDIEFGTTIEDIVAGTGLTVEVVQQSIKELIEAGLITPIIIAPSTDTIH
jgi:hypothetical protein